MATMAQAIKQVVETGEGPFTAEQIKSAIEQSYPGKWKPSTLQAHLYACVVNNPKSYLHHPYTLKFLYKNADDSFELYGEEKHGPNEWIPSDAEDSVETPDELVEASISLERDIEDHLINNLNAIEQGLIFIERQHNTDIGRIDILAKDRNGNHVIIEVKVGEAKDSVIGQIARYMGWFTRQGHKTRGLIVASGFPDGVRYAATMIPDLSLRSYRVSFAFEEASI